MISSSSVLDKVPIVSSQPHETLKALSRVSVLEYERVRLVNERHVTHELFLVLLLRIVDLRHEEARQLIPFLQNLLSVHQRVSGEMETHELDDSVVLLHFFESFETPRDGCRWCGVFRRRRGGGGRG